ncbi:MAG: proteasome assembly chaperone family protein [Promethearchaeia archaeon]
MVPEKFVCEKGEKSQLIIDNEDVEIKEGSTIIFGFAGLGLIGPIIANTMIEQIDDIQEIGFVASDLLPPIAVFHHGELMHPFRLYYTEKYNILLGISEVPFQVTSAYNDLAKTLCNWALTEVKAKQIVTFQGIPQKGMIEEFPVSYAAQKEYQDTFDKLDLKQLDKGIITGGEATIINVALTNNIDPIVLFTPAYKIPTPEGAASIIEVLNEVYGMELDTDKLLEQGKQIKERMEKLAEKASQYRQQQLRGPQKEEPSELYR